MKLFWCQCHCNQKASEGREQAHGVLFCFRNKVLLLFSIHISTLILLVKSAHGLLEYSDLTVEAGKEHRELHSPASIQTTACWSRLRRTPENPEHPGSRKPGKGWPSAKHCQAGSATSPEWCNSRVGACYSEHTVPGICELLPGDRQLQHSYQAQGSHKEKEGWCLSSLQC